MDNTHEFPSYAFASRKVYRQFKVKHELTLKPWTNARFDTFMCRGVEWNRKTITEPHLYVSGVSYADAFVLSGRLD